MQVQAAQYEADRAFEQYNLADPKNRLVVSTLEERLNGRLAEFDAAKTRLGSLVQANAALSAEQRGRLHELASNFELVWHHPQADPVLKKLLLRTAIQEILVVHQEKQQRLMATIHWQGGVHTRLHVNKRATPVGRKADASLVETVSELAKSLSDGEIARILNVKKMRTPTGLGWSQDRVRDFRQHHHLRAERRPAEVENFGLKRAAAYLGISRRALLQLERMGVISRNQVTDFAPCRISREDLDSERVRGLVRALKLTGRLPKGGCPKDQLGLFDDKQTT